MHILLPPSETKRLGGGSVFLRPSLSHDRSLRTARTAVSEALVALSGNEEAAVAALKLGVKNREERTLNLQLETSGAMPAIERYTGVLYDALAATDLPQSAQEWLASHASIQSALFGLIAAGDAIPAYRLSASSRLEKLGVPLKRVWQSAHDTIDWGSFGWVLDLRSKDYAELAPLPEGIGVYLHVVQRSDDGTVRALNHFNKAAKGDLLRRLALSAPIIENTNQMLTWAASQGIEIIAAPRTGELTLVTQLGAPMLKSP